MLRMEASVAISEAAIASVAIDIAAVAATSEVTESAVISVHRNLKIHDVIKIL